MRYFLTVSYLFRYLRHQPLTLFMGHYCMPLKHIAFLTIWFFTLTLPPARAQTVQGYVVDAISKDSLADVHVRHMNEQTGTVTDIHGYFRTVAQIGDSLRFSSTGYRAQTARVNRSPLVIRLIPDTVMLQEVRVQANRVNMYRDTATNQPLRLPGVPFVEDPVRLKPMTWTWGRENFSDDAPLMLGLNASVAGPISYFMRQEKNQRKYERALEAAAAQRGYHQAVNDEANRKLLVDQFQLTDRQYDSLLILFNQKRSRSVEGVTQEEAFAAIFWFFSDALRPE